MLALFRNGGRWWGGCNMIFKGHVHSRVVGTSTGSGKKRKGDEVSWGERERPNRVVTSI